MSLSLLLIMAANRLVMDNGEPSTYQLLYLQDQKSFRLHGHRFSEWGNDRLGCCFADKFYQHVGYT
jgi:hypothetical protein